MKNRQLIAAVIALSAIATASSAFADFGGRFEGPVAASTKTRAEVQAELAQARAEGASMHWDERVLIYQWARPEWIQPRPNVEGAQGVAGARYSGRTREEVRAEAIEHTKNFKPGSGEMYGR